MDRVSYGDGAPIVALATAPAESALAVIRTSGPSCITLASSRFSKPEALCTAPGNTLVHGWLVDAQGQRLDEVIASVFRAPRSFTGEDAVEFTSHGGMATTRAIVDALRGAGFRQALPGEFSLRAFLNGKLDLTQAEAIMELVGAKTDEARAHSVGRLCGSLHGEIEAVKATLVGALAANELQLDYSEDDGVGGGEEDGILADRLAIEAALGKLASLAASYRVERLYQNGATVAVAGRPNAGKSSLFNRLAREDRAIVSETPGTTRDYIETWIAVAGIPLRLVDTAGLRDSDDPIERSGIERSHAILAEAATALYLVDGAAGLMPEDEAFLATLAGKPVLKLWNKVDRAHRPVPEGFLPLSAKTGEGLPELFSRLEAILLEIEGGARHGTKEEGAAGRAGIASQRQKELVDRAVGALETALELDDERRPLDLAAVELREAVNALGEITGEVSTDDLLEAMFSRFCVGK